MIYFCTAYRHSGRDIIASKIPVDAGVYNEPEIHKTEIEQVEWFTQQFLPHAQTTKDNEYLYLISNSQTIFYQLRVAVKQGLLKSEDITVWFVDGEGRYFYPIISEHGRLDNWPEGFFDMWDKQLDELL